MTDYNNFEFSKKDYILTYIIGATISSVVAYLFYQSIVAIILFSPFGILYVKKKKAENISKRKWQLNQEFKDGLQSLSASLNAGYSIENAFVEARGDLSMMYEKESLIVKEFTNIVNSLNMNKAVEDVLEELANRSDVEDIKNFAEVFKTAKRTGGDIIKIIKMTSKTIGDKIEVKREILTMITAKQFESRIMNLIPFGIIMYLLIFSPEFLEPLYHNAMGIMVMSISLIIYVVAVALAEKIINVEV